jgi:hypothetical protein
MIEFLFEKLRLDGSALDTDWDVLLRLVADFSIVIPPAHVPLYREEEFCVVEFAMQIAQWLASVREHPTDFSYNSMEYDETGLVSIHKYQHGWKVTALHQDYVEDQLFSIEEIETAVGTFVARLKKEVRDRFQCDISHLVSGGPIAL